MKEKILSQYNEQSKTMLEKYGYVDVGGLQMGINFVEDIKTIDIIGKSAAYDKNLLILHGDKDETVPLETSDRYLEVFGERCLLHIVKDAGHTFNSVDWENEVLEYTVAYLQEELKTS